MANKLSTTDSTFLAASVAPEDLTCGDFVAALSEVVEFPSFFWNDSVGAAPGELIRLRSAASDAGTPLRVKAICLPFVLVKWPCGRLRTIDVRQLQLVRLKKPYAKAVWRALRRQAKKKHRGSGR